MVAPRLSARGGRPFQDCARIWGERPGPCLCRWPVGDLVASGDFTQVWAQARDADRASATGGRHTLWDVCKDAAYQLVEFPEEETTETAARLRDIVDRLALCFGQQMLTAESWSHPATVRRAVSGLLAELETDVSPADDARLLGRSAAEHLGELLPE
ncbi:MULTISPECIES: hypothetical protein [Pseudofrankia]|uniref:hypothetical protein n=1 Tax=Pseudofrankia TaxID=2994363 RepID=UPI000234CB88|nr:MULTISPECIES: hypothetical protein [Pseudofrankia]OHV37009.1 hypothetical protein BCD49_17340 [Pseudofrankia sp. EUN1h]